MKHYQVTFHEIDLIGGTQVTPFILHFTSTDPLTREDVEGLYYSTYNHRAKKLADHPQTEIKELRFTKFERPAK